MRTPASIARHPVHPILVTLPIGLWVFSFACDLVFAFGTRNPVWKTVALYTMVGGLIGALVAAIPGLIELVSLPGRSRRTAIAHMSVNVVVAALFGLDIWQRATSGDAGAGSSATVWLSLFAISLLAVSGWLGGKLVDERGVAVQIERFDTLGDRSHVVDLSQFRERQMKNGKLRQRRNGKQPPRPKEPPLSSRKP